MARLPPSHIDGTSPPAVASTDSGGDGGPSANDNNALAADLSLRSVLARAKYLLDVVLKRFAPLTELPVEPPSDADPDLWVALGGLKESQARDALMMHTRDIEIYLDRDYQSLPPSLDDAVDVTTGWWDDIDPDKAASVDKAFDETLSDDNVGPFYPKELPPTPSAAAAPGVTRSGSPSMRDRIAALKNKTEAGEDELVVDFSKLYGPEHPLRLMRGDVMWIFGDTGIAKSGFVANVAYLVGNADGHPPRRVHDNSFEMDDDLLTERYLQIAHGYRVGYDRETATTYDEVAEALAREDAERLLAPIDHITFDGMGSGRCTMAQLYDRITASEADLVIVDTIEGLVPPVENGRRLDGYDAQVRLIQDLLKLAFHARVALIVVHHLNKQGQVNTRKGDVPEISDTKGASDAVQQSHFCVGFGGSRGSTVRRAILRKRRKTQVLGPSTSDAGELGELRLLGDPLTLRFLPLPIQ
ncbi:MAG: AAA family ATPase [Bacteroidota bacterium]